MKYTTFLACAALALCLCAPQAWAAPKQGKPAIQQTNKTKASAKAAKAKQTTSKAAPAQAEPAKKAAAKTQKTAAAKHSRDKGKTAATHAAKGKGKTAAAQSPKHAQKQLSAKNSAAGRHAEKGRHARAAARTAYHANRHVPSRHRSGRASQTAVVNKEHLRLIPTIKRPKTIYRGDVCPTLISVGEKITGIASTKLDLAYRAGGTSPVTGFDCSGFVQWVFARHGISLPRSARDQEYVGRKVDRNSLQPGDILIFRSPTASSGRHTAIYVGNDKFIHSPRTGKTIRYDELGNTYWRTHYLTARRVLKAPPCETGSSSLSIKDRNVFFENFDPVEY